MIRPDRALSLMSLIRHQKKGGGTSPFPLMPEARILREKRNIRQKECSRVLGRDRFGGTRAAPAFRKRPMYLKEGPDPAGEEGLIS